MKCAGPVACSNEATWRIEATDREAQLEHRLYRCNLHVLELVETFLLRRAEVRVVPLPAWN